MFATGYSDAQYANRHLANFNPDRSINPHDVDQSGAGQFKRVGKFDPMKSSVPGGIFGGEVDERPRGNVAAIQRVKALPTGGSDFLSRLEAAEQRDGQGIYSDRAQIHAAGGRVGKARPSTAETPSTAHSRAAKILNSHQSVSDHYQQQQLQRQQSWLERQGHLTSFKDGRDGGESAAGAKSRALQVREENLAAQSRGLHQSWHQQQQHAEALKRQEQQALLQQQRAMAMQQQERQAVQQQQMMRHEQMQRQSAMAVQQQQQQQYALAQNDVAIKTSWARNQAGRRNQGGIQLG